MTRWLRRLFGDHLPADFPSTLDDRENALAAASVSSGGYLVATELGLWVPSGAAARRIGWQLLSKIIWADGVLTVTEAEQTGTAGDVILLRDLPATKFELAAPGKVPLMVRQRVDGSIRLRHRQELEQGGVWFVYRKVPGTDTSVLQARPDPGVDPSLVVAIAQEVSVKLGQITER